MFEPKSLTATIYVKFHYKQPEAKVGENEVEMISGILDKASDLSPELQETLIKFMDYLSNLNNQRQAEPDK